MAISPPQWRRPYPVAAASRVVVQAGTLLGMLFAVAKLSPQTFGTFSVVWASTVILNSVVYTGLYEYLVRVVDVESAKHAVFWSFIGLGCAASLVLVGAGVLSGFGGGDALRHCYLMLAPLPILTGYHGWCDALLTRRGHAATAAVCFAVGEIGGVLALIAALSLGLELGALITWRIVTLMVSGVGIGLFVPDRPRLRASKASLSSHPTQ